MHLAKFSISIVEEIIRKIPMRVAPMIRLTKKDYYDSVPKKDEK